MVETYERFTEHLTDNKLDLATTKLALGPTLAFDSANENVRRQLGRRRHADPRVSGAVRRAAGFANLGKTLQESCEGIRRLPRRMPSLCLAASLNPAERKFPSMSDRGFEILLEDEALLGVVKPAGIATQAPPGIESLESRIKAYLAGDGDPADVYLGIPHRLDRPVSGAMVFAKTHRVARQPVPPVRAPPGRQDGIGPACKEPSSRPMAPGRITCARSTASRERWSSRPRIPAPSTPCCTTARSAAIDTARGWKSSSKPDARTRSACKPSSRGFPILGDEHYGSTIPFGPQCEDERLRSIALHARELTFTHTLSHEEIRLVADCTAWKELDFSRWLAEAVREFNCELGWIIAGGRGSRRAGVRRVFDLR